MSTICCGGNRQYWCNEDGGGDCGNAKWYYVEMKLEKMVIDIDGRMIVRIVIVNYDSDNLF